MGARTYRTFKQILRASKTRRQRKAKGTVAAAPPGTVAAAPPGTVAAAPQAKKMTRRVKRRPFFAGAPQKKQKGGAPPLSGESTVVTPLDDDEESPRVVRSAADYTASLPT